MTTSFSDNINFRMIRLTDGRQTESIEFTLGGGEDCFANVQPLGNHVSRFSSSLSALNVTPTEFSDSNFLASRQPLSNNSEILCEPNGTPQLFNSSERSQMAAFADRSTTPTPLNYQTAREHSMTPIQLLTGRERSISSSPAEITAIGGRSEHSIPELSESAAPLTPRPTVRSSLNRSILPVRSISLSPTRLIKNKAVNHSQQEQPRASTTAPGASTFNNELVSSGIHKITKKVKAEPLISESSANTLSNWNPNDNREDTTERLYDHVSLLVIHMFVDGKPLTSEQELRVRTLDPNSSVQIVEIWQDGNRLYHKLPNTSTRRH
ncbi:hypothetical protein M3Y94_00545700 [Aphelenchoides besseyi]|nr:hypothetical protein M3Y94_00545700 [Aphelenchoides besseyi]KAI6225752.1 hypothetical protein M3Y95_00730200 [Aphelenchoides besseyi]